MYMTSFKIILYIAKLIVRFIYLTVNVRTSVTSVNHDYTYIHVSYSVTLSLAIQ